MNPLFDQEHDRFNTQSAKFNREGLKQLFGTDDLYPFWVADTDFKSPEAIIKGLHSRVDEGIFGYEYASPEFLPSIVNWFNTRLNVELDSKWIQFTPTVASSLSMCLDLFTQEGDGIIIMSPVYMEFGSAIKKTNRRTVDVPLLNVNAHYEIDWELLEEKASTSKALIFCNPHNPGGRVWTKDELEKLVKVCKKHNLILISDEIHADIVYTDYQFTSLLNFKDIHDQLIVCYSPAKVFNIPSVTNSLAILPNDEKRKAFDELRARYNLGRTFAFQRVAMEMGFSKGAQWVDDFNAYIESNYTMCSEFFKLELPEVQMMKQEGTYLIWVDMSNIPISGQKLIRYIAEEAKMGVSNGVAFGRSGKNFIRINIACPNAILKKHLEMLKAALKSLLN